VSGEQGPLSILPGADAPQELTPGVEPVFQERVFGAAEAAGFQAIDFRSRFLTQDMSE